MFLQYFFTCVISIFSEKLAASLNKLRLLQDKGLEGIKSSDLSRTHRERLLRNVFLREVVRGWYISKPYDEDLGDSTS